MCLDLKSIQTFLKNVHRLLSCKYRWGFRPKLLKQNQHFPPCSDFSSAYSQMSSAFEALSPYHIAPRFQNIYFGNARTTLQPGFHTEARIQE